MAGTVAGGLKASIANIRRNPNHYREIGKIGGSRSTTGGFASKKVGADGLTGRERAKLADMKGGRISKLGKARK